MIRETLAIFGEPERPPLAAFLMGKSFMPPVKPEPVPAEPTVTERLAALEADVSTVKDQKPTPTSVET